MAEHDVDLFVIGGGSGGVRAARIAASHGAKVMIAEEFRFGGTCVIRGCVPKKLLVYASRFADEFEDAAGFGWQVEEPRFDWPTLIAAKDKEITRLEDAYASNLQRAQVETVKSRAVIEGPHEVRLVADGRKVSARVILIATGGTPSHEPDFQGSDLTITSNEVFDLKRQPEQIVIVGGGYIAVEFAGVFAGLGSKVTIVHRGDHLLRGFDDDLRMALEEAYKAKGIELRFSSTIERVERSGGGLSVTLSDGTALQANEVLMATGRVPNSAGLGLEKVGVKLSFRGAIEVDDFSQTSVPSIYAVGDVTDRVALTPVAIREGHAFADTVFGNMKRSLDHTLIPTAVFSTPEIGTVGLAEAAAKAKYPNLCVFEARFRPMKATISGRQERTLMKVLVDRDTDKVVGVHVFGHDAGEIIQMAGIALSMGATKADFDRTVAVHPTAAEELVTMRMPVR